MSVGLLMSAFSMPMEYSVSALMCAYILSNTLSALSASGS